MSCRISRKKVGPRGLLTQWNYKQNIHFNKIFITSEIFS